MRADRAIARKLGRARKRRRERGVALIMVLLAIVLLTVYLTEAQQQSATAFSAAIAERDRLRAEYLARSSINLQRMLIAFEPTVRKAIAPIYALVSRGQAPQIPVWEFATDVLAPFNCPSEDGGMNTMFGSVDLSSAENLGTAGVGCFEPVVVDEDSKLNINTAARGDIISRTRLAQDLLAMMAPPQYNPLFEKHDPDGQLSDRQAICSAIIDWADSDEEFEACNPTAQAPTSTGAEDNFYQTIGLPYFRKNAAYDSLEELRLVRGIGDDFWATFIDPDPNDPKKRNVTVWGSGRINVNTANAQTLLTLVCSGAPDSELCNNIEQAGAFLSVVALVRSFTAGAPLFASAQDFITTMKGGGLVGPFLASLGVQPVQFKSEAEMRNRITTESKMFSLYATGVVKNGSRETRVGVHAVADYRKARKIGDAGALAGLLGDDTGRGDTGTGVPGIGVPGMGGTGAITAEDLAATTLANPLGNIVYWRVR